MSIRRNTSLIAVDFGSTTVRLLQVAGQHVTAVELPCEIFASDPVNGAPDPGGLSEDLQRVIEGGGFHGRRCAVALPSSAFLTDIVAIPEFEDEDRVEGLACEAVDRFGVKPEEVTAGALVLAPPPTPTIAPAVPPPVANPGAPTGPEQLLLAVRRRTAMLALEPLLRAELAPVRLEHAALAALRAAWAHWSRQPRGVVAFVHVEPTLATMLMARDGALLFHRAIAGQFGTPRSAAAAGDPDAIPLEVRAAGADRRAFRWSGLADEILQCLRYVERRGAGQWPSALIASGPCAGQVELIATLESICGVPTHAMTGCGVVDPLPATLSPEIWATALGMAAVDLEQRTLLDTRRAA